MNEPAEIPVYAVCAECKIDTETAASRAWARQHAEHGMLDLVAEPIFRSDHLTREFRDVDRPKLTLLKLRGNLAPAPNAAAAYFGMPGDRASHLYG